MAEPIRVVVVDDHPIVRQGLRAYLSTREGIEVVGDAADGEAAVVMAERLRPDVVLMDLAMPGMGGVAAIRRIVALGLGCRVVVLTSAASDDQVIPAIRAGATGYLRKDVAPSRVDDAIRAVHKGEGMLDPHVAGVVMAEVAAARSGSGAGAGDVRSLTPRELEVLGLLGEGLSNRELAARLFVSEKTVKTHVSAVFSKLGLLDRTQAALYAVRHGLVETEPGTGS